MATTQLRFLGPAWLRRGEGTVSLSSAKALALLGYLAASPRPVPRDVAVDLLWPASGPDAGRKNLRNALWAIGRALGKGVVEAETDRLALTPETWVDLRVLEGEAAAAAGPRADLAAMPADALEALAELYRGPFLDGLVLDDAPDFEQWLSAARDRLAARQLHVLEALADARRRAGDWAGLADAARRALAVDPLHEPLHRALVEALARSGQRAEALRAYEGLRQALRTELGVEPLPETEALAAAVQAGSLGPVEAARPSPREPGGLPGERAPLPFVGRDAELATLAGAVAAAAVAGDGRCVRVVALTGEAGIGKSRLWREAARRLPAAAVHGETRALESTRALPFVPIVDLLSRPDPFGRLLDRGSPLAAVWLAEVARLLPDVRLARPELPPPVELPPEEERRRLFEALTQVLRAAGGQPLVVFVDDVHQADRTTLDWLGYAVHRLRDEPFLLVLAYRSAEASAPLEALVAGWERDGIVLRLALERLDEGAVAELLASLGADAAASRRLRRLSGGNPLFLAELARMGGEDVPPRLAGAIRARLGQLGEGARQVLQAAAVLEPDADFVALRRTAGRSEDETLDALDALVAAAILVEVDGRFAFAHPLVGTVVREDLGAARRAVLHRRAAEALAASRAGDPAPVAGQLGRHYAAAGEPERAAHYLALAGARALAQSATGEGVALFEQALALDASPARHLDLARARIRMGDAAGARAAFQAAYDAFAETGDARQAAEAGLGLAGTFLGTGQPDQVLAWAERGLAHLDGIDDPAAQALGRILLGAGGQDGGQSSNEAEGHLMEAARLAREHDLPRVLAQSQFELGNLRARQGELAAARAAYGDAIQLAQAADEPLLEALGHNNAAYHALLAGDLPDARAHRDAGLALAERLELAAARQWLFSTAGEIELAEGSWDAAEGWFRNALAEAERQDNLDQVANTRANLARVERGRGRLREAGLLLAAAAAVAARLQSPHLQATIGLEQAEVALAGGDAAGAAEALARAEDVLAGRSFTALDERAAALRAALASEATANGSKGASRASR